MRGRERSRELLVGAAVLFAAACPLAADWLVLKDGAGRVETKGPWELRGSQVVFHLPNGALSSLRARDVDLDASQQATAAAAAPAPSPSPAPAEPAAKKPVVTYTDKDFAHFEPAPTPTARVAAATAAAAPANRIVVSEWHQDFGTSAKGVTLVGEVTNNSRDLVGEIHVTARLLDDKGTLLATGEALLGTSILRAGSRTNFRVEFPGVFNFSDAQFEVGSLALKTSAGTGG